MISVWKRVAQNRLLDCSLVTLAVVCLIRITILLPTRVFDYDFNHSYISSRLLLEGKNPYTTPLAPLSEKLGFAFSEEIPHATNPPGLVWFFAPFAALDPRWAFAAWVVVQAASLTLILWLTRRLLRERLTKRGWRLICCAALCSQAVYWNFYYSHVELLLAAIVLAAYAWHNAGKHTAACLAIVAAGVLKLYPIVLLPWFVWRSEGPARVRLGRAALSLACGAIVVFLTGPSLWRDFWRDGLAVVAAWAVNHTFNFSLPSFVINLGYTAYGFAPPSAVAELWWTMGVTAGLASIGLAYAACLRSQERETEFCLMCVAMLIGSITTWGYYFTFLIFPMATAALRVVANPSRVRVLFLVLLLLALNDLSPETTPFLNHHLYLKILWNYVPLCGLVALAISLARELRPLNHSQDRERIRALLVSRSR